MTSSDPKNTCIFCSIVHGKDQKTKIVYQDDEFVAFRDIHPATEHHYLVIPRHHLENPKHISADHLDLIERQIDAGKKLLEVQGADTEKVIFGYHWPPFHTVRHCHLHVISATDQMSWLSRMIFRPNSFWFVTADWVLERMKKMKSDTKSAL